MDVLRAVMCGVVMLWASSWCHAQQSDPFAVGSTYRGNRFFFDNMGKVAGDPQKWSLKVTERKGNTFKGEIIFETREGKVEYPVEGTAPAAGDGAVRFAGEKGLFMQAFAGMIKKGEIGLQFAGRSVRGTAVKGTAVLRPQGTK
jgi:hypothetical protein